MSARLHKLLAAAGLMLAMIAFAAPAFAIQPDEMLKDPKLEARARNIDKQLRCLVCQNESIDESDADLAHDLRVLVRKRILKGDSDDQVKQYIVARYGNYVLLKPPFDPETYLLWLGPALLLVCATGVVVFYYRRNATATPAAPLSAEEAERLAGLIGDDSAGEF